MHYPVFSVSSFCLVLAVVVFEFVLAVLEVSLAHLSMQQELRPQKSA